MCILREGIEPCVPLADGFGLPLIRESCATQQGGSEFQIWYIVWVITQTGIFCKGYPKLSVFVAYGYVLFLLFYDLGGNFETAKSPYPPELPR